MSTENSLPFGTPPAGFVQTGNQPFEMSSPAEQPAPMESPPSGMTMTENVDPFASVGNFQLAPTTPQQNKYKIMDLFWMINPKFYNKQQPNQNEAHFVIISYNIDFGNIRISFFNLTSNSIQNGNIIFLENLKRTVSGTIYPATAFNAISSPKLATICLEQLFRQIPGATWQQERPVCTIEKNEELLRFSIKDPKSGSHFYDFSGWQREAFLHACNFAVTQGFTLMAQQQLK